MTMGKGRVGNDFLLHVQTGVSSTGVAVFTAVGGQRGLSTETSREMIDLSDKTSDHSKSGYGRQDTTA
ncbi:MAG: phage tail protein, partial [Actinomycetota bacterium]|nr:phage tail protein [Actinomycetota bacterium]MDP9485356.1 phage tail protein [Actinomycetota bacterium]